jgi:hypothetical protein
LENCVVLMYAYALIMLSVPYTDSSTHTQHGYIINIRFLLRKKSGLKFVLKRGCYEHLIVLHSFLDTLAM